MKKKVLTRCLLGAPLGIAVSHLITVAISLTVHDGSFYPIVPEAAADFGSELTAVFVQTLCSMLYGAAFAGASVIWDVERWSLLRMTLTHLAVVSLATLPVAWIMRWMPHSVVGIIIYFAIFFGIYTVIWLSQYSAMKKRVQLWNKRLNKSNGQ